MPEEYFPGEIACIERLTHRSGVVKIVAKSYCAFEAYAGQGSSDSRQDCPEPGQLIWRFGADFSWLHHEMVEYLKNTYLGR